MFPLRITTHKALQKRRPHECKGRSLSLREMRNLPDLLESFLGQCERFRPEDATHEFHEIIHPLIRPPAPANLPSRREKYMHRASLVRKVGICFGEIFLERQDSIGNKAFWHISDVFQFRHHFPVPEFLLSSFFQLEMQGQPKAPVPGHEEHVELALDVHVLAVQDADAVRPRHEALCA